MRPPLCTTVSPCPPCCPMLFSARLIAGTNTIDTIGNRYTKNGKRHCTSASQPATAVAMTSVMFVIADTYPYCLVRSLPLKNIDTSEVEKGIIIPAPTPSMALTATNCPIVPATKYNAPLKRNNHKPMYNNLIYPILLLI